MTSKYKVIGGHVYKLIDPKTATKEELLDMVLAISQSSITNEVVEEDYLDLPEEVKDVRVRIKEYLINKKIILLTELKNNANCGGGTNQKYIDELKDKSIIKRVATGRLVDQVKLDEYI